jgi:hypothetical protein
MMTHARAIMKRPHLFLFREQFAMSNDPDISVAVTRRSRFNPRRLALVATSLGAGIASAGLVASLAALAA